MENIVVDVQERVERAQNYFKAGYNCAQAVVMAFDDVMHPVATAEFSKFADILNATLSQHHLLGFEIAPLEFHNLH